MLFSSEEKLQDRLQAIFITLAGERSLAVREAQRAIENVSYSHYLEAEHWYKFFNRIIKRDLEAEEADTLRRLPDLFGSTEFPKYTVDQYMHDLEEMDREYAANQVVFSDGSIVAENDVPF